MCAYPTVLAPQLQAHLERKQQKEEHFLICTDITHELDNSHACDCLPLWFLLQGSVKNPQLSSKREMIPNKLNMGEGRGGGCISVDEHTVLNTAASKFCHSNCLQNFESIFWIKNLGVLPKNLAQHCLYGLFQ